MEIALGALYSEEAVAAGMTTEKADMIFASLPYRIMAGLQIPVYEQIRERDADFYARLEAAGFQHDWGEDGLGAVHEVPAARLGLLHRRRRLRADRERRASSSSPARSTTSPRRPS